MKYYTKLSSSGSLHPLKAFCSVLISSFRWFWGLLFLLLAPCTLPVAFAQSASGLIINADRSSGAIINADTLYADAALQIQSNAKGLRLPQLTTAQRDAITTKANTAAKKTAITGMTIFNINSSVVEFYDGTNWILVDNLSTIPAWRMNGNSTATGDTILGSKNNTPLTFRTNNVERMRIYENGNGIDMKVPNLQLIGGAANPNPSITISTASILNYACPTLVFHRTQYAASVNMPIGGVYSQTGSPWNPTAGIEFITTENHTDTYHRGTAIRFSTIGSGNPAACTADGAERMRVDQNGNVGIGTTGPTQKLEVMGYVLADGFPTHSDIRYKKDIATIPNALSLVNKMRGASYTFRTNEFKEKNFDNKKHFGFIAQELEQIIPNVVDTQKDGYKTVNYQEIIPILTKAIQEQQAMISELKKEIDTLNAGSR